MLRSKRNTLEFNCERNMQKKTAKYKQVARKAKKQKKNGKPTRLL